jgi:hypothetical protein
MAENTSLGFHFSGSKTKGTNPSVQSKGQGEHREKK